MIKGRCTVCMARGVLRWGPGVWQRFARVVICLCDSCFAVRVAPDEIQG